MVLRHYCAGLCKLVVAVVLRSVQSEHVIDYYDPLSPQGSLY